MAHILLLEDDRDVRRTLSDSLEIDDHVVIGGHNGREGLNILEQADPLPDVIICDRNMPLMDGLEFIKTVRQNEAWSGIPILMISGSRVDELLAIKAGANAFLVKPFKYRELEAILNQLLEANGQAKTG